MTLKEFLKVIGKDDYVGIWNIDSKREDRPTQQHYCKSRNLTWDKIRNVIDYDVLGINHTEKGYLVRVYKRKDVDENYFQWQLVDKYFHRLDQRNEVR